MRLSPNHPHVVSACCGFGDVAASAFFVLWLSSHGIDNALLCDVERVSAVMQYQCIAPFSLSQKCAFEIEQG